jgi:hypothetical protein
LVLAAYRHAEDERRAKRTEERDALRELRRYRLEQCREPVEMTMIEPEPARLFRVPELSPYAV